MNVNSSSNKLLLATRSSDESVKLWYGDAINLNQSHDESPIPFSLLKEVAAVHSVHVSVLSLFVPSQSLDKVLIAIDLEGCGNGLFLKQYSLNGFQLDFGKSTGMYFGKMLNSFTKAIVKDQLSTHTFIRCDLQMLVVSQNIVPSVALLFNLGFLRLHFVKLGGVILIAKVTNSIVVLFLYTFVPPLLYHFAFAVRDG